jgi:DNA-binding transcriptional MerR regulator/methylmalonyl-CoA mutase cobalamin-binding subunit
VVDRAVTRRGHGARYPIRAVSKLTGIGIDTLRAWERRYGAVTPERDDRGRVYSDEDVARLRLISQAVAQGHAVGRVAALDDGDLRRLVTTAAPAAAASVRAALETTALRSALDTFDTAALDRELSRLAALLPPLELVRDVLLPALRETGEGWNRRRGAIAQEHLISATLRNLLGSSLRLYGGPGRGPRVLLATPAGDRHEMGTLAAAALAASEGFAVSYVGPDLPARDIVDAAVSAGAHVVVLGVTLAGRGSATAAALAAVARDLPRHVELWIGGPASHRHARTIGGRGLVLADIGAYAQQLARIAAHA